MMNKIENVLYEVPSGKPIDLPLHHMMVLGTTEFSGKTTFIESAITNAKYRGLTFRTKRGELGFEGAKQIPIFFNDKGLVTWQSLIGLMNSMFGDRIEREPGMKYAIQTICKRPTQAQSLDEIYQRAKAKQVEYKEGTFKEETFGKLVNYLEEVLPQMKKVNYTDKLGLEGPGMYMMDLVGLSDEVKNLILASVMKKIYEEMSNVITVLPEAAKYLPAKIWTPVKWVFNLVLSEGRAVGNYVWLDMQNLKGVDKLPIRNISVRLFGNQPDPYEIREMLRALPMGDDAPTAKQIMTLSVGEFYAKLNKGFVRVYARPVWLDERYAEGIAKGVFAADSDYIQAFRDEYKSAIAVGEIPTLPKINPVTRCYPMVPKQTLVVLKEVEKMIVIPVVKGRIENLKDIEPLGTNLAGATLLGKANEEEKVDENGKDNPITQTPLDQSSQTRPESEINLEEKQLIIRITHSEKHMDLSTDTQHGQILYVLTVDAKGESKRGSEIMELALEHGWRIPPGSWNAIASQMISKGLLVKTVVGYRSPRFVKFDIKKAITT